MNGGGGVRVLGGLLAVLTVWLAPMRAWAQKGAQPLAPEVESGIQEAWKAGRETVRNGIGVGMDKEFEELVKACAPDPDERTALEKLKDQAIDASLDKARERMVAGWRGRVAGMPPEGALAWLHKTAGGGFPRATALARNGLYPDPREQPVWKDGLAKVLTPTHLSAWRGVLAERHTQTRKKVDDAVEAGGRMTQETVRQTLLDTLVSWTEVLAAPPERMAQLQEAAGAVAQAEADKWRKMQREAMSRRSDDQALLAVSTGMLRGLVPGDGDGDKMQREAEFRKRLTPEERERWEKARGVREERLMVALGRALVSRMEAKVPFTAAQRERLVPMAERMVRQEWTNQTKQQGGVPLPGWDELSLSEVIKRTPQQELSAILDPDQCQLWRQANQKPGAEPQNAGVLAAPMNAAVAIPGIAALPANFAGLVVNGNVLVRQGGPVPGPEKDAGTTRSGSPEDEEFERELSDFFQDKTAEAKKGQDATMAAQVNDAVRAAGIPPESVRLLQVAAKGAVNRALLAFEADLNQSLRGNIQAGSGLSLAKQLERMGWDVTAAMAQGVKPTQEQVWQSILQTALTPEQRTKWQAEQGRREQFDLQSAATLVLRVVDRDGPLSEEQEKKLEPMVENLLRKYRTELLGIEGNVPADPSDMSWPVSEVVSLAILTGIPRKEMKPILGETRFARWSKGESYTEALNNWREVVEEHQQNDRPNP